MSGEYAIINLGDLSRPATVLIEKISDAVGGVFRPFQIVRVAKAEAEAERIHADSQIQISDLQRRAFYRWLDEETRKQRNIEGITGQALPQLNDKSQPEKLQDDWIVHFFDKCRLVSDSQMQQLWARVLAGEANVPGSYSKRTIDFLSSLDKADAELFIGLLTFGWSIGFTIPLIYNTVDPIYAKHRIYFGDLCHLQSIGLIQFNQVTGYLRQGLPQKCTVFYYGRPLEIEFKGEADNKMEIGQVLLSKIGEQLAPICGSQQDPEFYTYVVSKWTQLGYIKESKTDQGPGDGAPTT